MAHRLGAGRDTRRPGRYGGGYAAEFASTNPLFFLRLDETSGTTLFDRMGNHNAAIVGSNYLLNQIGAVNNVDPGARAIKLTGASTYFDLVHGTWMDVTTAASWAFWIYPFANANNAGIMSRYNNANGGGQDWLIWYNTASQLEFRLLIASSSRNVAMNMPQLKSWSRVVCTYDGAFQKLYCNGFEVDSAAVTGNIGTGAGNINIGAYQSGNWSIQNHMLDEVSMHNVALTPAQVLADFNAGIGRR